MAVGLAEEADAFTRIDPVRIGDLIVFTPQIGPLPWGLIEALRNVPERIALLDGIVEAGFIFDVLIVILGNRNNFV